MNFHQTLWPHIPEDIFFSHCYEPLNPALKLPFFPDVKAKVSVYAPPHANFSLYYCVERGPKAVQR
jgi:hypothetical protein